MLLGVHHVFRYYFYENNWLYVVCLAVAAGSNNCKCLEVGKF